MGDYGTKMITFSVDSEKLVNAMAYIAERVPGSTKMILSKILYFADKEHLLAYGRPITGDVYIRMDHGPVPSLGLNLMRGKASTRQSVVYRAKMQTMPNHEIRVLSSPDLNYLSNSDCRELDASIEKYGKMTAKQLRDVSHHEETWKRTADNSPIPFELMFEGRQDAALMLELLSERVAEGRGKAEE
jgi:uncharacterized phage-associated protein